MSLITETDALAAFCGGTQRGVHAVQFRQERELGWIRLPAMRSHAFAIADARRK